MKPQRKNPRAAEKHELEAFAEKYEMLASVYGDPVEAVFEVMSNSEDETIILRAADLLLSYRFPRIKALETAGARQGPQLNLTIVTSQPIAAANPPTLELNPRGD